MSFFSGLPSMPTFDELKAKAGLSGSPPPLGSAGYVAPPTTLGGRRLRRDRKMRGGYAGVTPLLPGIYDGVSSGAAAPVAAAPAGGSKRRRSKSRSRGGKKSKKTKRSRSKSRQRR